MRGNPKQPARNAIRVDAPVLRGVSMPTTPRAGTPTRSPSGVESARHVTGESCVASSPITQRVRTCTNALALSCAQCLADARAAAHASSGAAPSNRAKYGRFLPPTGGLAQAG